MKENLNVTLESQLYIDICNRTLQCGQSVEVDLIMSFPLGMHHVQQKSS